MLSNFFLVKIVPFMR